MSLRLYYQPMLPGRGEVIRLTLELLGQAYVDVGRLPESQGGGPKAIAAFLEPNPSGDVRRRPPILEHNGRYLGQTVAILRYLSRLYGGLPEGHPHGDALGECLLSQLDVLDEMHQAHHPIASALYYEDQKPEAIRAAKYLRDDRLPKYLGDFEAQARAHGPYLFGEAPCAADACLFQICRGLDYAFPTWWQRMAPAYPNITACSEKFSRLPAIADDLASPRTVAFTNHGIFRRYPELDEE